MNKFLSTLLTSLFVIGSILTGLAQEANSLLWKISGKDLNKPSYLFGTIHIVPEGSYFFTQKMQAALDKSEVLMLEINMDIPLGEQMKMAVQMIMPDGKTWADFLSEEEYISLKSSFVDSLGIKEKKFGKYSKIRPVYVSGLIIMELLGKVKMYEQELSKMAKKSKKPIIGLETVKEQIDIVNALSIEKQMNDLKENSATLLTDYNKLLAAYLSQNLKELATLVGNKGEVDEIEAELLTDRNIKWIKGIEQQATENATFFAVGAMHLIGKEGLISLLREAGYSVEAVQ